MFTILWLENIDGRDYLEVQGLDEKVLECILEKWGGRVRIGFNWLRIEPSGGSM